MNLASAVAATLFLLLVMACSAGLDDTTQTRVGDGRIWEQVSSASAKSPTDVLCLPAVPLAVSVGDTWTISDSSRSKEFQPGCPREQPRSGFWHSLQVSSRAAFVTPSTREADAW